MKIEIEIQRQPQGGSSYYILRNGDPWCIAVADRHASANEVHISVVFDDWSDAEGKPSADRVTFSCRYGYDVIGQELPAFTLVQEDRREPLFGKRLTREEALKHPLIKDFWRVVDEISRVDSEFIAV